MLGYLEENITAFFLIKESSKNQTIQPLQNVQNKSLWNEIP